MKTILIIRIGVALIVGLLLSLVYFDVIRVLQPVSYSMTFLYSEKGIYIQARISSVQEFTEGVPVTVHAVGSIGPRFVNFFIVILCFSGAYFIENGQVVPTINQEPFAGAYLNVTTTRPIENLTIFFGNGAYLVGPDQSIEWLSPTDSIPYIIVTYKNTTVVNGIGQNVHASQSFPAKSLHIESYSSELTDLP